MVKNTKPAAKKQRRRTTKNKEPPSNQRRMDTYTRDYMKLLMNPCSGKLVHAPLSGTSAPGYLARNYRRFTLHLTAGSNNGYLAWFPSYHTGGNEQSSAGGNLFVFETNSTSNAPTNTVTEPWGAATATTSPRGATLRDPSWGFVSSTTVSSARTIAACAQVMYTGSTANTSGVVGVCSGMTPQQVLTGNAGGPLTVEMALSLCPNVSRTPLTAREARWMPDEQVPQMRSPLGNIVPVNTSSPFEVGASATSTTGITPVAHGTGFIIAWAGLPSTTSNDFMVELYKVIEWQPDAIGLTQATAAPTPSWSFGQIARTILQVAPTFYDAIAGGDYERLINRVMGGQGQIIT